MYVKKDIFKDISKDKIIDAMAESSEVLKKKLLI